MHKEKFLINKDMKKEKKEIKSFSKWFLLNSYLVPITRGLLVESKLVCMGQQCSAEPVGSTFSLGVRHLVHG